MGKYAIKDLEQLSGIKAHTIRIWEKRYRLIEPHRTHSNIRFYGDEDLKKIINVSLLNNNGIRISKISEMSEDEIVRKILELSESHTEASIYINQLIVAMVDLDEEIFEKILSGLFLRFSFEKTMTSILFPFLEKIGILWQTRNITPAQEHFISNLIRQKLIVAIDSLPLPPKNKQKVLLFLPENELHEIGLLFYHFIIRKAGYRTYYLGQTVPHPDLKSVYEVHKPDILVTTITTSISKSALVQYLARLSDDFPDTQILVSGFQIQNLENNGHMRFFRNYQDLKTTLNIS